MKSRLLSLVLSLVLMPLSYAADLHDIYDSALNYDPVVNKAKALSQAAKYGVDKQKAFLLPQISASADYKSSRGDDIDFGSAEQIEYEVEENTFTWGTRLDVSVYDRSKWVNLSKAEKLYRQAELAHSKEVQDLILRTASAYFAVLRAMDTLDFNNAELDAIAKQLEQTKQRFKVGLVAMTDVHEAQANYDIKLAEKISAENELELRREELRVITGRYQNDLAKLDISKFKPVTPAPDDIHYWLDRAHRANLELLIARLNTEIAWDDIRLASAKHLPSISVGAEYETEKTTETIEGLELRKPSLTSKSVAMTGEMNIYSGGQSNAEVSEAKYKHEASRQDFEAAFRATTRSVRDAYNKVVASVARVSALEQAVTSAESALQSTQAGFTAGTRTIVDVLNSTRDVFRARSNLAGARYDYIISSLELKNESGSLSELDLHEINRTLVAS